MSDRIQQFTEFRQRMNERILAHDNQVVRRYFALDTQTYKAGALPLKTKELLGLSASMVLRCDDGEGRPPLDARVRSEGGVRARAGRSGDESGW